MGKEFSVWKEILKTSIKTMIVLLIIVVFSSLSLYVINPRFSAKVCAEIGWNKAEISCYELLYARNKDTSDLYNLIVKLGNAKDYEKQNDYINKMQALNNYSDFCNSMDNSVIQSFNAGKTDAQNLSLIYGTNEYISSREIINLVNLTKYEDSYNVALETLSTDKTYELAVYNYAEYLYASDLSSDIKVNYFSKLKTDFGTYLQSKYDSLSTAENTADQILTAYTKLKIEYTEYLIALVTTPEDIADAYVAWQVANNEYNTLIIN